MTAPRGRPKNDRVPLHPHRRIAAAVVALAVNDLKRKPTEREEAKTWLQSRRGRAWIELLGFDHETMLDGLRKAGRL